MTLAAKAVPRRVNMMWWQIKISTNLQMWIVGVFASVMLAEIRTKRDDETSEWAKWNIHFFRQSGTDSYRQTAAMT
jgi:hypothetical protein